MRPHEVLAALPVQELFYTSAPHGLKPGSQGFCTVAATAGMSGELMAKLEALSGYRPLFPPGDARAVDNPVAWAHWQVGSGSKMRHVLSRIGFAGFDYSQRTNKFAHHLVLESAALPAPGPAWLMLQPGLFQTHFNGEPRLLENPPALPGGDNALRVCEKWKQATGDAGWGGALAAAFTPDLPAISYLIYPAGMAVLELLHEALAMLPEAVRWQVTFNTYFTELPAGLSCIWRCVPEGTEPAGRARASRGLVIDLTKPLGAPPESALTQAARTGVPPAPVPETAPHRASPTQDSPGHRVKTASAELPMVLETQAPATDGLAAAARRRHEPASEPEPAGWPKSVIAALLIAACAATACAGFAAGWFLRAHTQLPQPSAERRAAMPTAVSHAQLEQHQKRTTEIKRLQSSLARARLRLLRAKAAAKTKKRRHSVAVRPHKTHSRRPAAPPVATTPARHKKPRESGRSARGAVATVRFTRKGLPVAGWQTLLAVAGRGGAHVALALPRGAGGNGGRGGFALLKFTGRAGDYHVKERSPNGLGGFAYTSLATVRIARGELRWRWRPGPAMLALGSPARQLLRYSTLMITHSGKSRTVGFGAPRTARLFYHPADHAFFDRRLTFPAGLQAAFTVKVSGHAGRWKISRHGRRVEYDYPAKPTKSQHARRRKLLLLAHWRITLSLRGNVLHLAGTLRKTLDTLARQQRRLPAIIEKLGHTLRTDERTAKRRTGAATNFKARLARLPVYSGQRRLLRERAAFAETKAVAARRLVKADRKTRNADVALLTRGRLEYRLLKTCPKVKIRIFLRGSHVGVATITVAPPGPRGAAGS